MPGNKPGEALRSTCYAERMVEPAALLHVSYADYVTAEATASAKHEWLNGVVYAMSGGTAAHAGLAATLARLLGNQLVGQRCRIFSSDLRVRILATGLSTYPDLSVVCGKLARDPDSETAITNPTLLVEILSDSSEAYDRGEKFAHYRRIPSLQEYVLVGQRAPFVEVYRRNEAQQWVLVAEARAGEQASLVSIGCTLVVDELYADPLAEEANG